MITVKGIRDVTINNQKRLYGNHIDFVESQIALSAHDGHDFYNLDYEKENIEIMPYFRLSGYRVELLPIGSNYKIQISW